MLPQNWIIQQCCILRQIFYRHQIGMSLFVYYVGHVMSVSSLNKYIGLV